MSIKLGICAFGVCFLVLLATNCVTASLQKIAFYNQTNCAGPSQTITATNNNLRETWMANANSTLVVGLWKIDVEFGILKNRVNPNDAYPPQGRCINKSEWPVDTGSPLNYTIYGVERFGPPDMATSQLVLYSGPYFTGTPFTVSQTLDPLVIGLGPVEIQSYAHFSNDTWTLFSLAKFNGTTRTLVPSSGNGRDQFTYARNAILTVGSVIKRTGGGGGGSGVNQIGASLLISVFVSVFTFVV